MSDPASGPQQFDGPAAEETTARIAAAGTAVLEGVGRAVIGTRAPLRLALAAVLAGGHVLFEDMPGLGKTLVARSLAQTLGLGFRRLQCTPDLLPSDVTGSSIFDPVERSFDFQPGPVFTGLLLADEINRTSPKTQSALLEAMAEGQVSIEGSTHRLPVPFHVFATSNPVEFEGTYPLPEAQLDRFLVRLALGYPTAGAEADIVAKRLERGLVEPVLEAVLDPLALRTLQEDLARVPVSADIVAYAVRLTAASRGLDEVQVGASPRGSQALVLMARAMAALDGRAYVVPEDLKEVAVPVLAHRLVLSPAAWARGADPVGLIDEITGSVEVPATAP
ncbi:MAG: AAA family ATPase [Arthrobacter sp.]|uniref:AAA family ATPase n=1 Tax=unclassified Arthrobacter TaxID=235627 RepID=UPI002650E399|nr:MoxR family ATPase [Micrococcaceae bacterium]MDN5813065.1 MoxR family ATPase [Micrococcaceae bacterium]MDN5822899.1 MoxR family ATPase [Micrococcaceae bacterium]MDN5879352.1 MoxR family ATPase [Micrococcaceae bacterium]MDN5904583.1 MoxR family ATPase [Micrococcaceae bacterium]